MGMQEANQGGRADALRELAATLAQAIDECIDMKLLPQLARQYRETVRELEEIDAPQYDDIDGIVGELEHVR